jgi:hypothetical protein
MAEYALVVDGRVTRFQEYDGKPQDPLGKPNWKWMAVERTAAPAYDQITSRLKQSVIIGTDIVSVTYTVEPRSTADVEGKVKAELEKLGALVKVIVNHEQRLRALEGKPALTRVQIEAAIKQVFTE